MSSAASPPVVATGVSAVASPDASTGAPVAAPPVAATGAPAAVSAVATTGVSAAALPDLMGAARGAPVAAGPGTLGSLGQALPAIHTAILAQDPSGRPGEYQNIYGELTDSDGRLMHTPRAAGSNIHRRRPQDQRGSYEYLPDGQVVWRNGYNQIEWWKLPSGRWSKNAPPQHQGWNHRRGSNSVPPTRDTRARRTY